MIGEKRFSVIITTHAARYPTLDLVLQGWIEQSAADQIWLLDGGGRFRSKLVDPRLAIFNMPMDLGTKMDYAMALLTDGDFIILADDDVIVHPGFLLDLYRGYHLVGDSIVGIIGRTFHGIPYWGKTIFYKASAIREPQRVGFVGVIYFSPRKYFGFDVRGCPRNCDDLWWQMKIFPQLPKFVVPSRKYLNLPEASGESAMYKQPLLRKQREEFYAQYYRENYEKQGRIF